MIRTQKEIIRDELLRNKKTTNWDIIKKYRITRLSEYIRQLRRDGMNIYSRHEKSKETGKSYVIYELIEDSNDKPGKTRGDESE